MRQMFVIKLYNIIVCMFILFACERKEKKVFLIDSPKNNTQLSLKNDNLNQNYFRIDTALIENKNLGHILSVSNNVSEEILFSICNCEKQNKDNSIKIQITTAIPTKTEILKGESGVRILNMDNMDNFKGQMKFLTFHIKDSLIERIDLLSKSTDYDYENSDFSEIEIGKYKINISTFNYSIASNVIGDFELLLPENYGYISNDTILRGVFRCNNWRINTREEIKNLNFKNKRKGFQVNDWRE